MQTWVIWLVPVVILLAVGLVVATTAVVTRRKHSHPLTHEQVLRELRRARRDSRFGSRYDPSDTECPPNGYAMGGGPVSP